MRTDRKSPRPRGGLCAIVILSAPLWCISLSVLDDTDMLCMSRVKCRALQKDCWELLLSIGFSCSKNSNAATARCGAGAIATVRRVFRRRDDARVFHESPWQQSSESAEIPLEGFRGRRHARRGQRVRSVQRRHRPVVVPYRRSDARGAHLHRRSAGAECVFFYVFLLYLLLCDFESCPALNVDCALIHNHSIDDFWRNMIIL